LVEAAWTAVGRAPQYGSLYNRVAAKKAKQIAIVAVARRMLEDAWTMLIRDEVFCMKKEAFCLKTVTSNVADVRINDSALAGVHSAQAVVDPSDAG
jgi:hypothetical protein